MKLYLTKRLDGLYSPHSDSDYEESKKIKPGQTVETKLSNERIMWQHKRFWIVLDLAYDNMPEQFDEIYPTKESLRKGLLLQAGHVEIQRKVDGSETVAAGSMSFLNLKQREFEQVYSAIIDVVLKHFILELNLQNQIIDLT